MDREITLSETAREVLERRYLVKDDNGVVIETVSGLLERVARNVAKAEDSYKKGPSSKDTAHSFYEMMANLDFLPNSPTLMNAGRALGQLSACFVLPVGDSMEEIFQAIKDTALIHKSGGGTGFSFSRLRPSGDIVHKTQGVSSGPISFMTAFDAATETVKQGGKRRGANMGILRIDHPDILNFITCKEQNDRLNNFNISVAATEKFMKAVEEKKSYDLVNPHDGQVAGQLDAGEVFGLIVKQAWKNGEPGIVFIDRMNKDNPTPQIGEIESTNPCGEQPLLPYESCNLGSINLSNFVNEGKLDYGRLKEITRLSVRFLDDVIDINKYPIKQIDKMTRSNRKIGLGVMGFADMLVQLEIPYNSGEAVSLAEKVMKAIQTEGRKMSEELATERGVFPNFKGSIWDKKGIKVRNATITTIAPTGTISMIADASSGVEPLFAISFIKNVMDKDELVMTNPIFLKLARDRGFYSEELMKEIAEKGNLHGIKVVPADVKKYFVTAHDVTPEWHMKIQVAFQKYTDNAVSKTVNFPNNATEKDVAGVYMLAYKSGAKGVTIYRDGSRDEQVLNIGKVNKTETDVEIIIQEQVSRIRRRPQITTGKTIQMITGCGKLYVTVNFDEEGKPFEIFSTMGKAGGCASSQAEALSRMVSMALRSDMDPKVIIKHLRNITCHRPAGFGPNRITSCSDAIAQAIEKVIAQPQLEIFEEFPVSDDAPAIQEEMIMVSEAVEEVTPDETHGNRESHIGGVCPECGGPIEYEGGCLVCRSCGYSECA